MTRTSAAVLALLAAAPLEAHADFPRLGIFRKRNKDTKEEQPQRAKQLLETLKSDTDEKKRVAAATELREIDTRANPDVIPGVISALQRDPSPTVRGELVETLGLLKPISPTAGAALEQIYTSDPAESVRKAAQQALWQYHLNGYRPAGTAGVQSQTSEPPLARPKSAPVSVTPPAPPVLKATPVAPSMTIPTPSRTPTATPTSLAPAIATPAVRPNALPIARGVVYPQTIEPPLAKAQLEANVAPVNPEPVMTRKPTPTPIPVAKPSKSAPVVKPMPSPMAAPMPAPTSAPMAIPIPVPEATPAPAPATPAIPFGGVPATPTPGGTLVPSIAPPSIPSVPPPASAPSIPPPKG